MKKIILVAVMLLSGCSGGSSHGVKDAVGETSVKFIICSQAEKNCFISARFRDLDGCRNYKQWAEMVCQTDAGTGQMVCDKAKRRAFSYCVL